MAVLTVRHLDLGNTSLGPGHLAAVLTEVIWSNEIEELELTGADMDTDSVPAQLLTDSLACLSSINLTSTCLSRTQLLSVLHSATVYWSTLSHLNLSTLDLSCLPSSLLAAATTNLTSLRINYSKLSTEQLTAVVRSVVKGGQVEVMEMTRQDLSLLTVRDCTKLARLRTLTSLQCNYCSMTDEITSTLLTSATRPASGLAQLGLVRADLSRIPVKTLITARNNLTRLNINYCKLTPQQRAAIK